MKKLQPVFFALVLLLAAGLVLQSFSSRFERHPDGKDVQINAFTSLEVDGPFDVYFTQDNTVSARVEADASIADDIAFNQSDNILRIRFAKGKEHTDNGEIKIYLSTPELQGVKIAGSGDFHSQNTLSSDNNLDLEIAGSGNVYAQLSVMSLAASIAGSGDMKLEGDAHQMRVSVAGSGDFGGSKLTCQEVSVSVTGSGDARVYASKKLTASIAGSGDVVYGGKPASVEKNVSGSGSFREE